MRLGYLGIGGACVAAVTIAVVVLAQRASGDDDGEQVPVHRVSKAAFRREVPADGNLRAVQATPILAPQEARMPLKVAWIVKDGDRVTKDRVVVRFDSAEMKEFLRDGNDSTTQARQRIAKERVTSSSARRKRDRDAEIAEKEMTAARARQYKDDDVFSRNEIIESEIDTELAAAKVSHARATEKIEHSVSSGKLDVLRVQEKQAELEVSRATKALSMLDVSSPHDGILLLHRDWRGRTMGPGDTVWPGQKIAEIPRDDAMEAQVYVLEADGGALAAGMKATLVIESQPGREYPAVIKQVETLAQPRFAEVPVQYFAVVLTVERGDGDVMKIGQRVRATILVEASEAIAVPRQAVFTDRGRSFVYRRTRNQFDKVYVELGAGTAGRVIVTSGLAEGDDIALRDPTGSKDAGVGGGQASTERVGETERSDDAPR
jgi:RND family efflux transporter MFP subunit